MNAPTALLFGLAIRLCPTDRRGWLDAMQAELEFIPPSQRLRFAGGCLAAALVWRIWTPRGVRTLAQAGLVTASGSLAVLLTINAMLGTFGRLSPLMAGLGLAYAAGALCTVRWGVRGMAAFALGGMALNTVFMLAWAGGVAEPIAFLRALSIEAYFILATFLGAAASAQAVAGRLERSA